MDGKTIGLMVAVGLLVVATAWQQARLGQLSAEIEVLRTTPAAASAEARSPKGQTSEERTADSKRRNRRERAEKRRQRRMLDPERIQEDLNQAAEEQGIEGPQVDQAMEAFLGHTERIAELREQVRSGEVKSADASARARESREAVRTELESFVDVETAEALVTAVLPGGPKGGERVRTEPSAENEADDSEGEE